MSKNETYEKINSLDNKNDLVAFLQGCMTENLNHARHIETEIHTFTGIYMAVVAGVLGFGFSISKDWLSDIVNILPILMYGILLGGGWISLNLLNRWYEAFDRHMVYAEKAYYMLEALLMRGKEVSDVVEIWNWSKDELAELADLDPIFAFNHPKKPKVISTRKLVKGFHMVIFVVMLIVFISSLISVIVSA